ncbi:multiple sugar transport system substrate-binding protein [Paenibacillus rhizosphaerae]|uniref:Multiple sugar transport system substrate-binding protein n=1 Tax=Paenibacillus rhizosphaerae TaxID=297318 RepID=A0A839TP05_9BACL|nr:sugar ABC transporter substrate-binding protein [Paenibacillus rhizosphaerae]MBB3128536.1 multiple sugar transport system substrate-binding protein [Paenibacillus rhizosphaerae]
MQKNCVRFKSWNVLLSALLILALLVTGCGGSGSAGSSGSTANSNDESATNNGGGGDAAKPGEKVTIEFWAQKFEETTDAWFKKWVAEFNKSQSDVEVKLTIVPGDAWDQKMKAAQAAGKAPDVRTINYGNVANAAKTGQILALNDLMDAKAFDDLYDNMKDFVSVNGKYYAYPKLVEPSAVLFYRKDMFKEAGLDPEKAPATWDELLDAAQKLTKKGVFGLSIAQTAGDLGWSSWGLQYNAAGHLAVTEDWSKADVNNDEYKSLLNFYQKAYQSGVMPKQALAGYTDIKPFGEGKIAMQICGSWAIGQLRNTYKNILDNVGVAPMASIDGDQTKPTATLGGWSLAIDGKSKHPQQAADFISYLVAGDPNIMIDFFKTSQFSKFSPRKSVDEAMKSDPEASKDTWRALISEKVIPYSKAEPVYPWDISFALATAIESAMKGTAVDKALEKADKDINDFITKSKLAGTNPKQ